MSEGASTASRRPKRRSPSYPSVSLETAIRRASELWKEERQYPTSVFTVVQHWGYKSLNGPASLTIAALIKFGLMSDEGSGNERRVKLTDLAVELLQNPVEEKRASARRTAALHPAIHREMWEQYGNSLPSDANLTWELTREKGFTESGARDFVRQYRETLLSARLDEEGFGAPEETVDADDADEEAPLRSNLVVESSRSQDRELLTREPNYSPSSLTEGAASAVTSYPVPISNGRNLSISANFPISEKEWERFMIVLQAMKPALVEAEADDANFE